MKPIFILPLFFVASSLYWVQAADNPPPGTQPASGQHLELIGKITRSTEGVYLLNTAPNLYYVPKNLPDLFKQDNLWVKAEVLIIGGHFTIQEYNLGDRSCRYKSLHNLLPKNQF